MADGVPITPGEGATVATDDAGASGQVQIIKLAVSADGSAAVIPATAEHGLDVDVTRAPGTVADGGSLPAVVYVIGGHDGSNVQVIATDANGVVQTDLLNEPTVAVTGVSTAAKQDSQTTLLTEIESAVDGVEALLTTIDTDTGNIATSVGTLDNAIAGNEMQVDVVGALPAGTNNIGQVDPRGNVAHDSADSGNPVKVGARARTALPTAVSQDDRTDNISDKFGRQLETTAPLDQRVSGSVKLTDTTSTTVLEAPGASVALVVTDILVVNGDESVGTFVEIFDESTKKWEGFATAKGGGFSSSNPDGLFVVTANKPVKAKAVTNSSETAVSISAYKIPA